MNDYDFFISKVGWEHFLICDLVKAVLSIEAVEEMRPFFNGYVQWLQKHTDGDIPEEIARQNIGWCFGEGMAQETVTLWSETVCAYHPIFGTKLPTQQKAFQEGLKLGKKLREKPFSEKATPREPEEPKDDKK